MWLWTVATRILLVLLRFALGLIPPCNVSSSCASVPVPSAASASGTSAMDADMPPEQSSGATIMTHCDVASVTECWTDVNPNACE